jgi:hypothetical protein
MIQWKSSAMKSTNPHFRQLAQRILTHEQGTEAPSSEVAASAVRVYMRLLAGFAALLGEAGSMGLFRRSLRLTEILFPFLSALRHTTVDTVLPSLSTCLQAQQAEVAQEASVELLAIHTELLAAFIGPQLTEQLLQEAWPHLRPSASEERHA